MSRFATMLVGLVLLTSAYGQSTGNLYWYQHQGRSDGTANWANGGNGVQFNGESSTIPVYVQLGFSDGELKLAYAESVASEILARAGVRLDWRIGSINHHREENPMALELDIRTGDTAHPGALGVAMVTDGTRIEIFWDRIRDSYNRGLINCVLGYVVAHEIGHMLQAVESHSAKGVMKARWTGADILAMSSGHLGFDEHSLALIRDGINMRATRTRVSRSSL